VIGEVRTMKLRMRKGWKHLRGHVAWALDDPEHSEHRWVPMRCLSLYQDAIHIADTEGESVYLVSYTRSEQIAGYPPTALRFITRGARFEREMGYTTR
jgi:hypothetical protein